MSSWKGRNASCLVQEAMQEDQEFLYVMAKISQRLRNFRIGSENFAILAKISQS